MAGLIILCINLFLLLAIDIRHLNSVVLTDYMLLGLLQRLLVLALVFFTHKSCFSGNLGRSCEEGTFGEFFDLLRMILMKQSTFYHMKLIAVNKPFRDNFYPTLVTVMEFSLLNFVHVLLLVHLQRQALCLCCDRFTYLSIISESGFTFLRKVYTRLQFP